MTPAKPGFTAEHLHRQIEIKLVSHVTVVKFKQATVTLISQVHSGAEI